MIDRTLCMVATRLILLTNGVYAFMFLQVESASHAATAVETYQLDVESTALV